MVDPWRLHPLPQTTNWPTHLGTPDHMTAFDALILGPPLSSGSRHQGHQLFCYRLFVITFLFSVVIDDLFSPFSHPDC